MRCGTLHCIRTFWLVLPFCLITGCWQEIEYRGSDPPTAQPSAPPSATTPPVAVAAEPTEPVEAIELAPNNPDVNNRYTATGGSEQAMPAEAPSEPPSSESETEAVPVSATVEAEPPQPAINTRQATWLLGSRLSLAALANDRGIAAEDVPKWFQEARSMAGLLQVPLGELPARPADSQGNGPSREVLAYLVDQGKIIGGQLATDHGVENAALFQMAWTSNLLLVMNQPDLAPVQHVIKLVTGAAERSQLPAKLWQPLLDTLANGSPAAAVRTAVRQLHADVESHLAAPVEQ
jgi:hypothetical protein